MDRVRMRDEAQPGQSAHVQLPDAHQPVLLAQAIHELNVHDRGCYVDGTFGRGGHARGILQRLGPMGQLWVFDKDPEALTYAQSLQAFDPRVRVVHASFATLRQQFTPASVDGVLLDLGVSSPQFDTPSRGFSFQSDGPLDMRMDPSQGQSAATWLAEAEEAEIAQVLWTFGEERYSRRIARAIVTQRATTPIQSTHQLAALIVSISPHHADKIHPATRSFQAIRIHINQELDDLKLGLLGALTVLRPGGRLVVISFHSLEDRIVKQFIRQYAKPPAGSRRLPEPSTKFIAQLASKGPIQRASTQEIIANPRARSAVMRVAQKLADGERQ